MARIAKSLDTLRSQVNALWPDRSKVNDGWIGDAAHQATPSDHNPNAAGVVTAFDITNDPAHGPDAGKLAETLRFSHDPRIKYIISNRRIASSLVSPWVWRPYSGANAHEEHVHVSVMADPKLYDDPRPWAIGKGVPAPPPVPGRLTNIFATEFGGVSDFERSAYDNHVITDTELGVSLPASIPAPRPKVRVIRGNTSIVCTIIDKGPWNTNDFYWLHGARPQAESGTDTTGRPTNKAGIDLTPAVMTALGVTGKPGTRSTTVDWEFVTEAAPVPIPTPSPPQAPPKEADMDILKLLPLLMRILQLLPQIQEAMRSGTSVLALLQKFAPDLIGLVQGVGGVLFPTLTANQQVEVGALTAFDQVQVRWIQNSLNTLGATPKLDPDGRYGALTKAAVSAFQSAHSVPAVDGWAGKITSAAIQTELNKLPQPAAAPIVAPVA